MIPLVVIVDDVVVSKNTNELQIGRGQPTAHIEALPRWVTDRVLCQNSALLK